MLERVKIVCEEKGTTLKDLSNKLGVTYQALYASLSGNPTIGKIKDIAKALDVDYVYLLEDSRELKFFVEYQGERKQITEQDLIKLFREK